MSSRYLEKLLNDINLSTQISRTSNAVVICKLIETTLGLYFAGTTNDNICCLNIVQEHTITPFLLKIVKNYKAALYSSSNNIVLDKLEHQLNGYFAGKIKCFSLPITAKGTMFQQSVWDSLQTIPYGQTISYQQQAQQLNHPAAIRAVANANSKNPISILIPCHRVIGSNGHLTGYAGGLQLKAKLLQLESAHCA